MMPKALIVDDEQTSRKIAGYFLAAAEINSDEVEDGERALFSILNHDHEILILDWNMPRLNGRETILLADDILKKMTLPQQLQRIKVIVYSSTRLEDMQIPVSAHFQMLGYICKRWDLDYQKKKFAEMVKQRKSAGERAC